MLVSRSYCLLPRNYGTKVYAGEEDGGASNGCLDEYIANDEISEQKRDEDEDNITNHLIDWEDPETKSKGESKSVSAYYIDRC